MKSLKFEFSLEEANTILAALAKLPYEVSVAVIEKIKSQANPQITPVAQPAEAEVIEG